MSDMTANVKDLHDIIQAQCTSERLPVGAVVIPNGYKLASTEDYESQASRLRGAFHTDLIQDFANYFARNVQADKLSHAPIFVDTKPICAMCPLDWMVGDDEPGHKEHIADCHPVALPDWMALRIAHGQPLAQDAMVNLLEDFGGLVTAYDDTGQGMPLSQILGAFRDAKITKQSEHAQKLDDSVIQRSAMESIDANANRRTPGKLTFVITPYEGFESRAVTARVIIRAHNDQPIFTLRVIGMEAIEHDIAAEFVNLVQAAVSEFFVGDEAPAIYVGRFNW